MRIMRKNKRASVSEVINTIIGMLLAIGAILVTLYIITAVIDMFTGGIDQGTIESIKHIDESIKALMESTETKCFIPFYVKPNFALVGFDAGDRNTMEFCGTNEEINKPGKCDIDACICMCDGGKFDLGEDDCKNAEYCYTYTETKQFRSKDDENTEIDLVLYGESCWGGFNEGVNLIIIEKQGQKIQIYRSAEIKDVVLCDELIEYEEESII